MQTIKRVADVALTSIYGVPIKVQIPSEGVEGDNAQPRLVQAVATQRAFLLAMASDPTCARSQGKSGLDELLYVQKIRQEIEGQSDEVVDARGYWRFEDDRAKGLREAAKKPTGQFGYGVPVGEHMVKADHCIVDFVLATVNMAEEPKAEAKPNGVEKALPAAEAAQA